MTAPPPAHEPAGVADGASTVTRRRILAVAAAVGAGGVLAACGGGADDTATGGDGGTSAGTGTEGSGSASGSAEPGAAGASLVATAEVPVGSGVILEAEKVVVTQPSEGTFKAFTAVCTHQSCIVSGVKNGVISCACHGSAFNAADGSVKNGPATRPLREIPVTVEGDQVVRS